MSAINEKFTKGNIAEYCGQRGYVVHNKIAGSTAGMLFEIAEGKYLVDVRFLNLLPGDDNDIVSFEVHPGISTTHATYRMVAEYCQRIRYEMGTIQVDYENGDIYFKVELPITDHGISTQTIDNIITSAERVLDEHTEAISALAHGYLPSTSEPTDNGVEMLKQTITVVEDEQMQAAFDSLHYYFKKESGHNTVTSNENSWLCEILAYNEQYNFHMDHDGKGLMTIRIGYGKKAVRVDTAYTRMLAVLFSRESARRKVGTMVLINNEVFAQTQISILEGEISKDTLDFLEATLIHTLRDLEQDIRDISHGIIPEKEEEHEESSSSIGSLLETFREHRYDDSTEQSDSDEDEDGESGSIFAHSFDDLPDDDEAILF